MFHALLAWLDHHAARPALRAEPLVKSVNQQLPRLLSSPAALDASAAWARAPLLDSLVALIRRLLELGPHIVTAPRSDGAPAGAVHVVVTLLRHCGAGRDESQRARLEGLGLLGPLLRHLRPRPGADGDPLELLMAAVRALLDDEVPLSLGELKEGESRATQARPRRPRAVRRLACESALAHAGAVAACADPRRARPPKGAHT